MQENMNLADSEEKSLDASATNGLCTIQLP